MARPRFRIVDKGQGRWKTKSDKQLKNADPGTATGGGAAKLTGKQRKVKKTKAKKAKESRRQNRGK